MPHDSRQIAIGDVHGCVHALDALLDAISPTPDDQLIFLGDLIDQGHESRDVIDRLIELKRRCSLVLIEGNHEEMMFAARESEKALRYWENCGGVATLNSFRFGGSLKDIPREYWELLAEGLPYYETEDQIFTHANYQPDLPMSAQPGYQLRWALFEPERMQPHVSGKSVWVGHTEQVQGEILDLGFAICIDTACWRYGWLTAVEVETKQVWQANRWGSLREVGEASQRGQLTRLLRKKLADAAPAVSAN
ncbi:MAG: metallophosphoesterase [Planctomycetaceae bacterium]|nr:metallophosphoesterase [Planctomycetaceae bacterium]